MPIMRGRSIFLTLAVSAAVLLLGRGICRAETVPAPAGPRTQNLPATPKSLNDLIEGARQYDGSRVELEGEVIGDIMRRANVTWINITDGTATLGVWGPAKLFTPIRLPGDYKTKGDTIRLEGVFYRADPRQGGELDIRATSLQVVKPGEPIPRQVESGRILLALGALLTAAALYLARKPVLARESI